MRNIVMCVLALALAASAGHAQTTQSADQRLDQFERRLNEIENKRQAEVKGRDEEIARLKQELSEVRAQRAAAPPAVASAPADSIEKSKQDVLKDIESPAPTVPTQRTPANFNPDLAVIGDFKG